MVRWHCPPDTGFEIQSLEVWGRARYLSVTKAPHNTEFDGEETFSFLSNRQAWETNPEAWKAAVLTTTLGPPPMVITVDPFGKTVVVSVSERCDVIRVTSHHLGVGIATAIHTASCHITDVQPHHSTLTLNLYHTHGHQKALYTCGQSKLIMNQRWPTLSPSDSRDVYNPRV